MTMRILNEQQKEAVQFGDGPLLIIAGAGTGKTTVITERIKYLVESGMAKTSEILALTFSEKAAAEMQARIDEITPIGYGEIAVQTFHAFCDQVLRDEALAIGMNTQFDLMTTVEAIQFVKKHLFEFDLNYYRPMGNPDKFIHGLLDHFSRLQDEDISPLDYLAWAKKKMDKISSKIGEGKIDLKTDNPELLDSLKWVELSGAYQKYDELKLKESKLDFGDLIYKTLFLFRARSNILASYQKRYKYLLVDEFQDVNYTQSVLAMLLAGESANVTIVGDDDQSIYRFRGAAVSNIIRFRKTYPKAHLVVLTANYRSSQFILDTAYGLISHNNPDRLEIHEGIDKKLKSKEKGKKTDIEYYHLGRSDHEVDLVTERIISLVDTEGYQYSEIAVLVRANNHADLFIGAFGRASIPYRFLGFENLFLQPEIVRLVSFLRVLIDPEDSKAMFLILSMQTFKIENQDLLKIVAWAKKNSIYLFEACERVGEIGVSEKTVEIVERILYILKTYRSEVFKKSAGEILLGLIKDIGYYKKLLESKTVEAEKEAKNLARFFEKLGLYEKENQGLNLNEVVDWIDLSSEMREVSPMTDDWGADDSVNVLTVHASKGLEFRVVFMVNLVSQRFPSTARKEQIPIPEELIKEDLPEGDFHLQEERRLFYVGMTRAKEKLILTSADYYGDGKQKKKQSVFLVEALAEKVNRDVEAKRNKDKPQEIEVPQKKAQKVAKKEDLRIDYLSYSQIETFKICPLHYRMRYILKLPTQPSSAQSFGISIHSALFKFYTDLKLGVKVNKEKLQEYLKESWVELGYSSKAHKLAAYEKAEQYLNDYFEHEFDLRKAPLALEQSFAVPLPLLEGEEKLVIGGKIDRIDELSDGTIEIIDYKTGAKIPTQKELDGDLQLTFYALAVTGGKERPFNFEPEEVRLSLYYFELGKKLTTTRTKQQLEDKVKEIYGVRQEILASLFECSKSFLCRDCEYKFLCES